MKVGIHRLNTRRRREERQNKAIHYGVTLFGTASVVAGMALWGYPPPYVILTLFIAGFAIMLVGAVILTPRRLDSFRNPRRRYTPRSQHNRLTVRFSARWSWTTIFLAIAGLVLIASAINWGSRPVTMAGIALLLIACITLVPTIVGRQPRPSYRR